MIIFVIISISALIYFYFENRFKYWSRKGVPTPVPSFPFGNIKETVFNRKYVGFLHKDFYDFFRSKGSKHGGVYIFNEPVYVAIEPDIIKHILIKDFQHFTSRGISVGENVEPLAANLLNLNGPKWKFLRSKLTPTFTSGKMKMMFENVKKCANEMIDVLKDMAPNQQPIDMKDILARYTTDVIGSCAFGIECNSIKNPKVKFRRYGQRMFDRSFFDSGKRILLVTSVGKFLHEMRFFKLANSDVTAFFSDLTKEIVSYRKSNHVERNDFLQLLIQLQNTDTENEDDKKLSMDQITAQAILFFAAGFETSSSTMNFCIFELAQHPEIQETLRDEIRSQKEELSYDTIMSMPYLDKVVSETLRKYPIASTLMRKCTQNYQLPNSDIVIEKDVNVIIPVYGLHHDPEYFPEPDDFDPERFSDQLKRERKACCYLPFGDGPRNCIGLRFGLMQTKIGLASIVRHFRISLNQNTLLPLEINKRSLVLTPKQTIWIDLVKIE